MAGTDPSGAVDLGEVLRQEVMRAHGERVTTESSWATLVEVGFSGREELRPVRVAIAQRGQNAPFALYYLVPWQPLFAVSRGDVVAMPPQLLTVTEPALVFGAPGSATPPPAALAAAVTATAEAALSVGENETERSGDLAAPLPEGLQIIRARRRRHYLELEVATPGSGAIAPASLRALAPSAMVRLFLTPDFGPVREQWIAPTPTSDEPEAIAAPRAIATPQEMAAPLATHISHLPAFGDQPFPDYQPKRTPDTIADYRGELEAAILALPPAGIDHLPALIRLLDEHQQRALQSAGAWREGNVVLGADPEEYEPSNEELLVSEIGGRIAEVVAASSPAAVEEVLDRAGTPARELTYGAISIRHADVMGSGRFFYASAPRPTAIVLRR